MPLGGLTLRRLGRSLRSFATAEVGGRAAVAAGLLLAPDGTWTTVTQEVTT